MSTQDAELCTAIILATEDAFRSKFKGEVAEGRKALACRDLMLLPSIKQAILANRALNEKKTHAQREEVFVRMAKQALKDHPLYSVVARRLRRPNDDGQGEKVWVIMRKCQYENVKSGTQLIEYVYDHVKVGVYVDDELLSFSYPAVARDIEAAVQQNLFMRMQLTGRADSYFLFPNMEAQWQLTTGEENPFQQEYLSLCKEFLKKDERVFEESSNLGISLEVDEKDPNYRLPDFLALKKQWKIKETVKQLAREEEDRREHLRQRQAREEHPVVTEK